MCTNAALVDSLECYMDELVENFEDFVKKSLLLITVAVGSVIAMLMYVLKVVTDRQQGTASTIAVETECRVPPCNLRRRSDSSLRSKSLQGIRSSSVQRDVIKSDFIPDCPESIPKTCTTGANTTLMPFIPSFEERVLKDIGLSNCTQTCDLPKQTRLRNCSTSRLVIPSLPSCLPKNHISPSRPCSKIMANSTSCCSMCCDDDR